MGTEIERKFLVEGQTWRAEVVASETMHQGYLAIDQGTTVRVRMGENNARVTIKGPSQGLVRAEFEYAIPRDDASELLGLCRERIVEKIRHRIMHADHVWEIDEFLGRNRGLIMAEVELQEVKQALALPLWLGQEVSGDPRYYNSNLSICPYGSWTATKTES